MTVMGSEAAATAVALGALVWSLLAWRHGRRAERAARAALATLAEVIDLVESVADGAARPGASLPGAAWPAAGPAPVPAIDRPAAAPRRATGPGPGEDHQAASMVAGGVPPAEILRQLGISRRELELATAVAGHKRRAVS